MKRTTTTNCLSIFVALILIGVIIWLIVVQVREHHLQNDPMLDKLRTDITPIFTQDNYYTGALSKLNDENPLNRVQLYRGNKSYTINKEKVYLCLYDKEGNYYPDMQLRYVLLHEMGHVITDSIGHTQEFHEKFEALLAKAIELGIYDPSFRVISDYCNHGKEE